MKELNTEEKAKACDGNYKTYTELINRLEEVKNAIKKQNYGIAMDILCKPYPRFEVTTQSEPKECEDERMACIEMCLTDANEQRFKDYNTNLKECLDWLAKQGKLVAYYEDKLDRCACENFNKGYKKALEKQGEQNHIDADEDWYRFVRWFVKQRTDDYTLIPSDDDIHKWGDNILNHARKLLEQNPSWSEEDERMLDIILSDINYAQKNFSDSKLIPYDRKVAWLKTFKNRAQPQLKQEWSEEDEKMVKDIIAAIDTLYYHGMVNWLKSLKGRIQPQSKQEWNKEEQQIIKDAASFILSCVNTAETKEEEERLEKLADKLQDLRPQNK